MILSTCTNQEIKYFAFGAYINYLATEYIDSDVGSLERT